MENTEARSSSSWLTRGRPRACFFLRGEKARTTAGLSATAVAVILSLSVLSICVSPVPAAASEVVGPYVASPRLQPVSPWEEVTIMTNITDYEAGPRSVTLFYSTDRTPPRRYVSVPMSLVYGDNRSGSYSGQIPPQANQTDVYFFTSVVGGSGQGHKTPFDEENPNHYKVLVFPSEMILTYVHIQNVDPKGLTADLSVTFRVYLPFQGEPPKSIRIEATNEFWDREPIEIPLSPSEKYIYNLNAELKGFHLIGDASLFPLDRYYLDLNFTEPQRTALVTFAAGEGSFTDYPGIYVWDFSSRTFTDPTAPAGSRINIRIDLARRTENGYRLILPLIFFFALLGSVPLVGRGYLPARATICIGVFTFSFGLYPSLIGVWIPLRASGVTLAETASWSLGIYAVILLMTSLLAGLVARDKDQKHGGSDLAFDLLGIFVTLFVLFQFKVVATPYVKMALFDVASSASLAGFNSAWLIILALVWGVIIKGTYLWSQKRATKAPVPEKSLEVMEEPLPPSRRYSSRMEDLELKRLQRT